MSYSEASFFDGQHAQHCADRDERNRLLRIRTKVRQVRKINPAAKARADAMWDAMDWQGRLPEGWTYKGGGEVSYDIAIGRESINHTSNVAGLFYDHIPATDEGRGGLHRLNGLTGRQAAAVLSEAFDAIHSSVMRDCTGTADVGAPVFCARYDPANGWGSTVGALVFLARIMAACHANPRCKVSVCA